MSSGFRIYLLSPANCGGKRASYLLRPDGRSELARRLREPAGASLGDVYTFMSGLYFRGKMAYARTFASPPPGAPGILVIVPGLGLRSPDTRIGLSELEAIARVPVDPDEPLYLDPLLQDATRLSVHTDQCDIILLGSVATAKYLLPLGAVLGDRLRYPQEFIGIGDMSRGALMLRCARDRRPLTYVPGAPTSPRAA